MSYHWKPNATAKREFACKMQEIENFCKMKGIEHSKSNDSYYFAINGQKYRVSNHSIESSNNRAYNDLNEQIRAKYHNDTRDEDTIYIHASKTRIIEIYNLLKQGYILNGKGHIKIKNKNNID